MNPYEPSSHAADHNGPIPKPMDRNHQPRVLWDARAYVVLFISVVAGFLTVTNAILYPWVSDSSIQLTLVFALIFGSAFLTGCADPRHPYLNWLAINIGCSIGALSMDTSDPTFGAHLVIHLIATWPICMAGTLIPTTICYLIPLRNDFLREWAGLKPLGKPDGPPEDCE